MGFHLYYLYYVMFPDSTRQLKWIIIVLSSERHLKIGLEKQKEANIGKFEIHLLPEPALAL